MKQQINLNEQLEYLNLYFAIEEQFGEIKDSFEVILFVLFYSVYVDKIVILEELKSRIKYIVNNDLNKYDKYMKRIIYDKDLEEGYIEVLHKEGCIKGYNKGYFKLSKAAINIFEMFSSSGDYDVIYDRMDNSDYIDRHKYLSGYDLAIAQHTSLSHYASIKYASEMLNKESISFKYKHHETVSKIPGTRLRVEWDLILGYNNKEYGVEVECGTTSNVDMDKKIWKHNLLTVNTKGKFNTVIVACPNKISLEKTKQNIERSINEYWLGYKRKDSKYKNPFKVEYIYLNLSTINSKNKIGKFIKESQRK